MAWTDVAQAAGDHDGLVIPPDFLLSISVEGLFEHAEITTEIRSAKLVVERSAPDRRLEHDLEWARDSAWPTDVAAFPVARGARDPQIGYRKTGQPGLGF